MRNLLLLVFLFTGTFSSVYSCPFTENEVTDSSAGFAQQAPFSFFNPVPATVKANDRVDLSFSANNAIVNQYRYMIVVPDPGTTAVAKAMLNWSSWTNNAFTDIIILKLPQEGRHTLVIEYRVYGSTEIRRFERSFDVKNSSNVTAPVGGTSGSSGRTSTNNSAIADAESRTDPEAKLAEALAKKDKALLLESLHDGAGLDVKGQHGGNIYHLLDAKLIDNQLLDVLDVRGFSINTTDNYGNTPLHISVMSRDKEYVKALIGHGADPNIMNNIELTPLHLAAFLNDSETARQLLDKGAEVDIKGNSGYTPLHIASMMNNEEVVRDLVNFGAKPGIKTVQKLNALQIAGIQDNILVKKIIKSKGQNNLNQSDIARMSRMTSMDQVKLTPQFEINLLYNKELLKKRNFAKVAGIVSVPLLAAGTAGTIYFRTEANKNYSAYRTAETMQLARQYYDKTLELDTYSYITGGISVTSIFGIVYSAIKRENISDRMRKTLY